MNEEDIIAEIKKAVALTMDGTYDEVRLLESHLMAIINDSRKDLTEQLIMMRNQFERFLHYVEEYRETQIDIKQGNKYNKGKCANQAMKIDEVIIFLHKSGYNTDRWKKKEEPKETKSVEQRGLFN